MDTDYLPDADYNTRAWRRLRKLILAREPMCRFCLADGLMVEATVADHITPHKGDRRMFWHGPFQSLCATCHNSTKARIERTNGRAVFQRVGADGLPVGGGW